MPNDEFYLTLSRLFTYALPPLTTPKKARPNLLEALFQCVTRKRSRARKRECTRKTCCFRFG